jgi:hypothetical protein
MKRLMIGAMALAVGVTAVRCGSSNNNNPTGPSTTGPIVFSATLSAANEVPPVTNAESGGRGTATITFNVPRDSAGVPSGGGSATFTVQLSGFPAGSAAQAAHIHPGAAGTNGTVLVNTGLSPAAPVLLSDGTGNISLTISNLTQADAVNIYNNPAGYYFNVHTPVNPGGAVRGQMVRTQ